uniref:Uncharacterized protein n=1 Tax=Cucumis melo TaxID=3656 RepID=A0A9I9EM08_CUCME
MTAIILIDDDDWYPTRLPVHYDIDMITNKGKDRGELATDREGFVTSHMGTQFCFRVYNTTPAHNVSFAAAPPLF